LPEIELIAAGYQQDFAGFAPLNLRNRGSRLSDCFRLGPSRAHSPDLLISIQQRPEPGSMSRPKIEARVVFSRSHGFLFQKSKAVFIYGRTLSPRIDSRPT
jgi:hypothetical protein